MTLKRIYILMCILGTVLPMSILLSWIAEHGLDLLLLFEHIIKPKMGAFAWADVLVSAIVLIIFIMVEGNRIKMQKLWLPILATFCVGVSLGLPLFLLMRENHLTQPNQ